MRVSREQAQANRARVVETAATLFRERGFDGIGVADLMKAAGLTHGGFYGQFASKEDLIAEACDKAVEGTLDYWSDRAARAEASERLAAVVQPYLSARHRDAPGNGCVMAALGAEAARQGKPVRKAVGAGVRRLADFLADLMPGKSAERRRAQALAAYATMVGAMVIARAVDDPKLSQEVLDAAYERIAG